MSHRSWKDRALRAERLKKRYWKDGDRFLKQTRDLINERDSWHANAIYWHGKLKAVRLIAAFATDKI